MFEHTTTVRMYDTDLGGVIFFTNQLKYAHDAFESFIESKGMSLAYFLKESPYAFPVVHVESDYSSPYSLGDRITVQLKTARIGETSFTLAHEIRRGGAIVGRGAITYVCVDKRKKEKTHLPDELLRLLKDLS